LPSFSSAETSLLVRPDFHLRCALGLATPAVRYPVDRRAALKADAHSAYRATRLTIDRGAARRPGDRYGHSYSRTLRHRNRGSIYSHCDAAKHVPVPCECAMVNTVRWEFLASYL